MNRLVASAAPREQGKSLKFPARPRYISTIVGSLRIRAIHQSRDLVMRFGGANSPPNNPGPLILGLFLSVSFPSAPPPSHAPGVGPR
jgi:hypothetical protein